MNYVCNDCQSYGTSDCLYCSEYKYDERYGEDGDDDIFNCDNDGEGYVK